MYKEFKELMEKYDECQEKWVSFYGTKNGFDEWFRGQVFNKNEDDQNTRKRMISDIESLYPANNHPEGPMLLWEAICQEWRSLPTAILERYRKNCLMREMVDVE